MSKSLHEIAKDYIMEVADAVAEVSKLSDAREEPDAKALYLAIQEAEGAIKKAGSRARGAIMDSDKKARDEIFS